MIVLLFLEELRLLAMPVGEGLYGRAAVQHGLWELAVVESDVTKDRLFEFLALSEAVALQDVLDPTVEPATMPIVSCRIGGVRRCSMPRELCPKVGDGLK